MGTSTALRKLARFLEECEAGAAVGDVGLDGVAGPDGTGAVTAAVELTLSTCGGADVALGAANVTDDGTLSLEFESLDAVVPATAGDVAVDVADAGFDDGSVAVTLSASVPVGDGGGSRASPPPSPSPTGSASADRPAGESAAPGPPDGPSDSKDADVPPFRDPDRLAEVYESCDTFAAMADALGMDVSAETVRRYMVDHDIHRPDSYDTGDDAEGDDARDDGGSDPDPGAGDAADGPEAATDADAGTDPVPEAAAGADDPESPVVLADGLGLPEDVTVETLVEAVERADTIHEIRRDIGVERAVARRMLRELDLLDLVAGRIATEADRDVGREEVLERLRAASAAQ